MHNYSDRFRSPVNGIAPQDNLSQGLKRITIPRRESIQCEIQRSILKSHDGKSVMSETQRSIVSLKIAPKLRYVKNIALYCVCVYTPPLPVQLQYRYVRKV